ncbi:3160_t:CDS:1 [Ambispora gerdemannii]|uniref:3160_t:CDS:1 n=1 Tax=Ambispora gerdemannii TaxID=144530 RepID=A0A9N8VT45_9GLOM|nr:3160_t:CDS:1 [Ambispora gerdemannii]
METTSGVVSETAHEAKGKAQQIISQTDQYYKRPYHFIIESWKESSFFRLYAYIAATYGIIPAVILVGWTIATLAIVVGVAGVGIVVAEGFFAFLGSLVFFPVVGTLLFIASLGGIVAGFAYGSLKVIRFALSQVGFLDQSISSQPGRPS